MRTDNPVAAEPEPADDGQGTGLEPESAIDIEIPVRLLAALRRCTAPAY